jgi:hypothetical protein
MSIASESGGTQSATVTTEHTLYTTTDEGAFQLWVDTANMAAGDQLELRIYCKKVSGGTSRVVYYNLWANAQTDEPHKVSPIEASLYEIKFTLKQIAGTGRSYPWRVVSIQKN